MRGAPNTGICDDRSVLANENSFKFYKYAQWKCPSLHAYINSKPGQWHRLCHLILNFVWWYGVYDTSTYHRQSQSSNALFSSFNFFLAEFIDEGCWISIPVFLCFVRPTVTTMFCQCTEFKETRHITFKSSFKRSSSISFKLVPRMMGKLSVMMRKWKTKQSVCRRCKFTNEYWKKDEKKVSTHFIPACGRLDGRSIEINWSGRRKRTQEKSDSFCYWLLWLLFRKCYDEWASAIQRCLKHIVCIWHTVDNMYIWINGEFPTLSASSLLCFAVLCVCVFFFLQKRIVNAMEFRHRATDLIKNWFSFSRVNYWTFHIFLTIFIFHLFP